MDLYCFHEGTSRLIVHTREQAQFEKTSPLQLKTGSNLRDKSQGLDSLCMPTLKTRCSRGVSRSSPQLQISVQRSFLSPCHFVE